MLEYLFNLTDRKTQASLSEKVVTLKKLAVGSRFSAKCLNLPARTGKLETHKENRLWYSSQEALKRYLDGRKRKRK